MGKIFSLPIKVISKTFRGKYMAELRQLWENDNLNFMAQLPWKKSIRSLNYALIFQKYFVFHEYEYNFYLFPYLRKLL